MAYKDIAKNSKGSSKTDNTKGTVGRDAGTSIIKRNIHGTRPFAGDVKRHG